MLCEAKSTQKAEANLASVSIPRAKSWSFDATQLFEEGKRKAISANQSIGRMRLPEILQPPFFSSMGVMVSIMFPPEANPRPKLDSAQYLPSEHQHCFVLKSAASNCRDSTFPSGVST